MELGLVQQRDPRRYVRLYERPLFLSPLTDENLHWGDSEPELWMPPDRLF